MKSIHLPGMKNVGDEVCSPALYFPDLFSGIEKINSEFEEDDSDFVCYGGGAIANSLITDLELRDNKKAILWGVGATQRSKSRLLPTHPVYSSRVVLRGIRDYHVNRPIDGGYEWVPCVSCMAPQFDSPPEPTKRIVYYGHKKVSPLDGLNNDEMDFDKVIDFLASGEVVVTSSYHGVYWATLLGRKVICLPFGSKFWGMKHPPYMISNINEIDISVLNSLRCYQDALEECRDSTIQFKEKVSNLLK